jgi:peroxiredoxin
LRSAYDEISGLGAEVVAVGTGDVRYAADFIASEDIPFPVLVDDDGEAATAASVRSTTWIGFMSKGNREGTRRIRKAGYKIGRPGKRVTQLGATFVVGAGPVVRYEHLDELTSDHAPVDEVLGALAG